MPRLPALLRTRVAPAPSPNSTAVARSVQSMIEVSFSEATTSTCSACSEATSPSATLSAYRKPVHAAWTSNAAARLAPSRAWRSQACEGSRRSGEQVATTRASISRGVRPVSWSTCSAAALAMQAFDSSGPATRRSRIPVRSRIHWSDVSRIFENSSFVITRLGVMTNDEFSKILDTSDQWIRERTGIRERRVAGPDESNACMGKAAAEQVLQETGLRPLDIDALVVATCSPDRLLPSQAGDLQALLGAKRALAFDVQAACTGFLYALNVAEGLVASEQAEQVLVVASEKLTSIMDWTDRATAVLFGDGAGATLVHKSAGKRGILSSYMKSDGTLAELLYRPGGGAGAGAPPACRRI